MGDGALGGGLVLIARHGERWKADVFARRTHGAGVRHVAEVVGSLDCVQRVAQAATVALRQANCDELLVEFLRSNRCRIIGPVTARRGSVAADEPANVAT